MPDIERTLARIDAVLSGRQVRSDAEFNEADHPRAANGQFGSGGGSAPAQRPNLAKSKGLWGSVKEAFGHTEAAEAEDNLRAAKIALEEATYEVSRREREARNATDPKERAVAKAKAAKAESEYQRVKAAMEKARAEYTEKVPEAAARRERERKAEIGRAHV